MQWKFVTQTKLDEYGTEIYNSLEQQMTCDHQCVSGGSSANIIRPYKRMGRNNNNHEYKQTMDKEMHVSMSEKTWFKYGCFKVEPDNRKEAQYPAYNIISNGMCVSAV